MDQVLLNKILALLKKSGKRGLGRHELYSSCHIRPKKRREFDAILILLQKKQLIVQNGHTYYHSDFLPVREASIVRLHKTFGFARYTDDNTDVFIPGRYFRGAMPGDRVLIAPIAARRNGPEGAVVRILEKGRSAFTATLMKEKDGYYLRPDSMLRYDIPIRPREAAPFQDGDKVLCEISRRGESHSDHQFRILKSFGSGQSAAHCAAAILELNGISADFPNEVEADAEFLLQKGISPHDYEKRLDLRGELIFTIDSASSKDLDDAVSIRRIPEGYALGVHIADVSHYVRSGSSLDEEAFHRGTSIYYANQVIPMLPKALSNGICSLNPGEDRLAFSCLMTVGKDGLLKDYHFQKSIICSAVKGIYKEINDVLNGTALPEISQKYAPMRDSLFQMQELAGILAANKKQRGAPEIETSESYLLLDEQSRAVGVAPRERGISERIIEDFMLLANEAAATFAKEKGIPFVYRVHEPPSEDKLESLHEVLSALGLDASKIRPGLPAAVLASLLNSTREQQIYPIINQNVLRSMSKAKYSEVPLGHYGLALDNYAHFTSPIRRYPDLSIHRILSAAISGMPVEKLQKRFQAFVLQSARQSSKTELEAIQLERNCEDCYKAEYMHSHLGEQFDGIISSAANHGLYVELPNTIEGLVKSETLPGGEYVYDGLLGFYNSQGKKYRVGDPVRVQCVAVDVSAGNIDFELC